MARANFPHRPTSGDSEIVEEIIADLDVLQDNMNGNLQADTNVKVAAPTGVVTGNTNNEGVSDAVTRSDHTHVIRGTEQLSADPTGSNFPGREYFNTTTNQKKLCIDAVTPVFVVSGNQAPSDVALHGSRHSAGGADPLLALAINENMMGRSLQTTNVGADVPNLKKNWLTAINAMSQITLAGQQLVQFTGKMVIENFSGNNVRVGWRIMDTEPEPDRFVCGSFAAGYVNNGTNGACAISETVSEAVGTHTYRLQLTGIQTGADPGANGCTIKIQNDLDGQPMLSYLSLVVG